MNENQLDSPTHISSALKIQQNDIGQASPSCSRAWTVTTRPGKSVELSQQLSTVSTFSSVGDMAFSQVTPSKQERHDTVPNLSAIMRQQDEQRHLHHGRGKTQQTSHLNSPAPSSGVNSLHFTYHNQ